MKTKEGKVREISMLKPRGIFQDIFLLNDCTATPQIKNESKTNSSLQVTKYPNVTIDFYLAPGVNEKLQSGPHAILSFFSSRNLKRWNDCSEDVGKS